jgi:hypothetical protein
MFPSAYAPPHFFAAARAVGALACLFGTLSWVTPAAAAQEKKLELIRVAADQRSFVLEKSGQRFTPWGVNYDHDEGGRLIEDYWDKEWAKVEEDFREIKELGANVVRIHLQVGKFMDGPEKARPQALDRLGELVKLAERLGLYLDLTGLGCYHKQDVPAWYDPLSEKDRWEVQARFWQAVAQRCESSNAIFCYDLMNEPVVPGGKRQAGDWLGPPFAGKHFVQFITLDQAGRPRPEIAQLWIKRLVRAIREKDRRHLITVGLVDWSLDRKGLTSGFVPDKIAPELDFVSVHIYPRGGKVDVALQTLAGFAVGKPVLIEETFPLHCSLEELDRFIDRSKDVAAGWVGFYWGKPRKEFEKPKTLVEAIVIKYLEWFEKKGKQFAPQRGENSEPVTGGGFFFATRAVKVRTRAPLCAGTHSDRPVDCPPNPISAARLLA